MLIIFIIAFVAFIAICDFSAFFLDEDLEDILYCTADVQESDVEEPALEDEVEEVVETASHPEVVEQNTSTHAESQSQILPEDDFEDDFDDYHGQDFSNISPDDFDADLLGAEDILQKIIEESTVV